MEPVYIKRITGLGDTKELLRQAIRWGGRGYGSVVYVHDDNSYVLLADEYVVLDEDDIDSIMEYYEGTSVEKQVVTSRGRTIELVD